MKIKSKFLVVITTILLVVLSFGINQASATEDSYAQGIIDSMPNKIVVNHTKNESLEDKLNALKNVNDEYEIVERGRSTLGEDYVIGVTYGIKRKNSDEILAEKNIRIIHTTDEMEDVYGKIPEVIKLKIQKNESDKAHESILSYIEDILKTEGIEYEIITFEDGYAGIELKNEIVNTHKVRIGVELEGTDSAYINFSGEMEKKVNIEYTELVQKSDDTTNIKLESDTSVIPANTVLECEKITANSAISDIITIIAVDEEKFVAYEITLKSNGVEIQPDGSVKISIPIPDTFDKSKLAIYRIGDNGEKIKYNYTISGNYVIINADHFSTYVIADLTTETNSSSNTENDTAENDNTTTSEESNKDEKKVKDQETITKNRNTPKTGDKVITYFIVLLLAGGIVVVTNKKKLKKINKH